MHHALRVAGFDLYTAYAHTFAETVGSLIISAFSGIISCNFVFNQRTGTLV